MQTPERFSSDEVRRALDLIGLLAEDRGASPSEVIDNLSALVRPSLSTRERIDAATIEFIDRMRRIRLRRNDRVGAQIFRDAGWDMLLDLFTAHQRSRPLSVSALCYSSGVPLTTAIRQLNRLEEHGLIIRDGDRSDGRRCFVSPTAKAIEVVTATVTELIDNFLAIQRECTRRI